MSTPSIHTSKLCVLNTQLRKIYPIIGKKKTQSMASPLTKYILKIPDGNLKAAIIKTLADIMHGINYWNVKKTHRGNLKYRRN